MDNDLGDVFATYDDPHDAWVMLETSYGSRQSGIQAVINAELTLAWWDGQTPIMTFHDHIKALRMRLTASDGIEQAIYFAKKVYFILFIA